jgi:Arc/MetJ-type ribon-helix-helix transcriptional regulator
MARPITLADLPEDLARFAEGRIAAGLSASVEDALRAGATALAEQQRREDAKLAKLRAAIDDGDASADAAPGVFDRVRVRHGLPLAR